MSSVRQVEDLLIECLYEGLIQGKLDQSASQLDVHYCIGRDIHPSEVNAMCDLLTNWCPPPLRPRASAPPRLYICALCASVRFALAHPVKMCTRMPCMNAQRSQIRLEQGFVDDSQARAKFLVMVQRLSLVDMS